MPPSLARWELSLISIRCVRTQFFTHWEASLFTSALSSQWPVRHLSTATAPAPSVAISRQPTPAVAYSHYRRQVPRPPLLLMKITTTGNALIFLPRLTSAFRSWRAL